MLRRLAITSTLFGTTCLASCGSVAHNRPTPAGLDPVYSIYSVLLRRLSRDVILVNDSTRPLQMCQPTEEHCWLSHIPLDYKTAADDYLLRNRNRATVQNLFPDSIQVRLQDLATSPPHGCHDAPRVTLSRVGFNRDTTRAIVAYSIVVGEGPYPGCGYLQGLVVALHRDHDGIWRLFQELAGWIT